MVDAEQVLGARFDQQRFHDFVVAQGKIPIPIIRQAVFERLSEVAGLTKSHQN
jgi:uncharacterized protein (DUF885 family)